MTWRPSPRRRARGGRANSSLDDAGSAGCRCRCLAGYSHRTACCCCCTGRRPPALRKLRELSSRPSSSRATERRGHHAERARAHLLCRYVPKLNSHRVRVFVALSAVARVTDLARVVRRFFFSSLVGAHSRSRNSSARAPFTPSPRARAPVPTPLESLACVAVRVRARGAARVAARRSASPFEW